MRPLAVLGALCCLALLPGCGGGDTTTATTSETTISAQSGPQGELSQDAIGSVPIGATTDQAKTAFGEPDAQRQTPGCELDGPNATPVDQWSWNVEDGTVTLSFDAPSGKLVSYQATSAKLPTTSGVRVGDSFQGLQDSYGPLLKPLQLGSAAPNADAGPWYVGKPGKSWLLFTVAGGEIKTIQGGDIKLCE